MKNKFILLGATFSLILSSCSLFQSYKNHKETVDVYEIDLLANSEDKKLENCLTKSLEVRFIDGEQYIPYLTLAQYASLYESHFDAKAVSAVTYERSAYSWTIEMGEDLYFYAAIIPSQKAIIKAGDIENTFDVNDNPRDLKSLNAYVRHQTGYEHLGERNYSIYSYGNCDMKVFREGGDYYFPLGLLDLAFSESSGIYFSYNYKHIYATRDAENYANFTFNDNGVDTTVDAQMAKSKSDAMMPEYLKEYNAGLLFFLMENLYGLKNMKGISSMKQYYIDSGVYKGLYSTDVERRSIAYSTALNMLDDNHTTIVSVNNTWDESVFAGYGPGVIARRYLRTALRQKREEYYTSRLGKAEEEGGSIVYSDDGRVAMFHFETFDFGTSEQVFDSRDDIKSDAYKYDTYFNFIRLFNEIKDHGGVKRVIIDVSTNGGGVVGVMMKLLALISSNNSATIAFCDEPTMGVSTYTSSVDVNRDGVFSEDEVFGDDFEIFLLTSDCSFSCGNAFPCYAKELGVRTIGEKSGGGECAVAVHYLPNSQYVYHSSNLHLGIYDAEKKEFTGLEGGAIPEFATNQRKPMCYVDENEYVVFDIPDNFYDINALQARLSNIA